MLCLAGSAHAESASTEDTAKFLAGLPVSAGSPLKPLEDMPSNQPHKAFFDTTFARVNKTQIDKVKAWSAEHIKVKRDTLFYFFGGPDFLYANAFFPDAKTYVLAGLESPGAVPDLSKLSKAEVTQALRALEGSLRSILGVTFFQTKFMSGDFHRSKVIGNVPVLYIFMARSGKEVHDATLISLNEDGSVSTDAKPRPGAAKGVKITFSSPGGPEQTLYYFATNVAGTSFKTSGLEAFCDKLGQGDAFVKSASYLLQGRDFSGIREFILSHSAAILQDDTGVPIYRFDKTWDLTPFGNYVGPIPLFRYAYQKPLAILHKTKKAEPLDFSISYRYRPHEASLVWAVKQGADEVKPTPASIDPEPTANTKPGQAKPTEPAKPDDKAGAKPKSEVRVAPGADETGGPKATDTKPSDKPADEKPADPKTNESKASDTKPSEPAADKPAAEPAPNTTTVPKSEPKAADSPAAH